MSENPRLFAGDCPVEMQHYALRDVVGLDLFGHSQFDHVRLKGPVPGVHLPDEAFLAPTVQPPVGLPIVLAGAESHGQIPGFSCFEEPLLNGLGDLLRMTHPDKPGDTNRITRLDQLDRFIGRHEFRHTLTLLFSPKPSSFTPVSRGYVLMVGLHHSTQRARIRLGRKTRIPGQGNVNCPFSPRTIEAPAVMH